MITFVEILIAVPFVLLVWYLLILDIDILEYEQWAKRND